MQLEPEVSLIHQLWDYGTNHARKLPGRQIKYGFPLLTISVPDASQTARIEFKELHGYSAYRQLHVDVYWPEADRHFAWYVELGSQEERGCRKKIRHNITKASRFLERDTLTSNHQVPMEDLHDVLYDLYA